MISFFGDAAIKAKYVARMQAHIAADELVQGTGFEEGRGCSIGCTFDSYDHFMDLELLGLPEQLARLSYAIFEGLPEKSDQKFALDFLMAVPVGVDCSPVLITTAIARHERDLMRLANNNEPYALQCKNAIQGVIDWLKAGAASSMALSARATADSAAESATDSAADLAAYLAARSAAESAAYLVANSATYSARSAAEPETDSAAESAAYSAAYQIEAQTLLAHMAALDSQTTLIEARK